jgi:hypothetical protein
MKIYLFDQKSKFQTHLKRLKKYAPIPYEKENLKHKTSTKSLQQGTDFSTLYLSDFFNYKIFPPNILQAYPQWVDENRSMQVNDTIVQQIQIPPFRVISQKLIVGVRIKEIIDDKDCKGFSYETLQGHVEKGISTFIVEQKNQSVNFTIKTYSSANGSFLSAFQFLSSLYQDYCTQQALNFVSSNLSSFSKPVI